MVLQLREEFNKNFTEKKYEEFLEDLNSKHPGDIVFRVAETPIFVPKDFTNKMIGACETIVDFIKDPGFKKLTERAIPAGENVPGENDHSHFIAFDFGICENGKGELGATVNRDAGIPYSSSRSRLIIPQVLEKHFDIPENFSDYLNGYNVDTYVQFLKEIILGNHDPENVILLELKPHEQKTRIDFYCTQDYLHIPIVCLTESYKGWK